MSREKMWRWDHPHAQVTGVEAEALVEKAFFFFAQQRS